MPDYHGALCELKYDDCESKFANCQNGGTCIDGINSFTCACPTFYSGPFCNVYDLPSTFSTIEETLETDIDQRNITITSFPSKSSTLPQTDTSSSITVSTTVESSTPLKSTNRFHTIWYPFVETTSSTDKNFDFLTSSSSTSSSISESTTESPLFVANVSPTYSVTNKQITETETVSLEPRTFHSISDEIHSITLTTKVEEYLTQKSIYNETMMTEIMSQENGGRMFTSTSDTSSEASSTTKYVPSTG